MPGLPKALEGLIAELAKLPGVGRRSAERMAFALLMSEQERPIALAEALVRLREQVGSCSICGYFTEAGECPLCGDRARDGSVICVVEQDLDVVAFEKGGGFRGLYHVLGGVLSPLKGVTPSSLRIGELMDRLSEGTVREVILATSPSVEGDATALYLARTLPIDLVKVTRIGRGIPMGGSLEHADGGTLRMALEGRRPMS